MLNLLLNFLTRVLMDGIKLDVITCKATGFYVRDCIIKAKEIVYEELEISSRMMNHTKKEDNVVDI